MMHIQLIRNHVIFNWGHVNLVLTRAWSGSWRWVQAARRQWPVVHGKHRSVRGVRCPTASRSTWQQSAVRSRRELQRTAEHSMDELFVQVNLVQSVHWRDIRIQCNMLCPSETQTGNYIVHAHWKLDSLFRSPYVCMWWLKCVCAGWIRSKSSRN